MIYSVFQDLKFAYTCDTYENPAKRPALALNNSTNIIKTPEKLHKVPTDVLAFKSIPQLVSSRAKRLQNITNTNCSISQRTSNVSMGIMHLKSPAKDIIESCQGRKTPRKNKNHPNTENISPSRCENQDTRLARFDANDVWRDNLPSSNEKHALDLRKVKVDVDSRPVNSVPKVGTKSSLQRKILFDDLPDDNGKRYDKVPPRLPLMSSSHQFASRHLLSQASNSQMKSPSGDSLTLSPVDQNGLGKEFRTLAPENTKDDVAGSSIVRVQNSQVNVRLQCILNLSQ